VDAIADDGAVSALEAREADSLDDVLNPADDGEAPEYWVVQDKNGFQVLVSFPHFSTKKVTIQSADAEKLEPSFGVPALDFVLLVAALAFAGIVGRRLRQA